MSTPSTSAPSLAAGSAVVPSPEPRSRTLMPGLIPRSLTSASPLALMLSAMRVKSPFSHRSLFGFIGSLPFVWSYDRHPAWRRETRARLAAQRLRRDTRARCSTLRSPSTAHEHTPGGQYEHDDEHSEDQPVG